MSILEEICLQQTGHQKQERNNGLAESAQPEGLAGLTRASTVGAGGCLPARWVMKDSPRRGAPCTGAPSTRRPVDSWPRAQPQPPRGPTPGICPTVGPGWWGRCAGRWPSPGARIRLPLSSGASAAICPCQSQRWSCRWDAGGGWPRVELALILEKEAGAGHGSSFRRQRVGAGLEASLPSLTCPQVRRPPGL